MQNLDYISTVRQINKVARKHYNKQSEIFNHKAYLEECFTVLQSFFNTVLPNEYIFSALSLKNQGNGAIEIVNNNTDIGYHFSKESFRDLFEPIIKKLLDDINNEACMSLTETLLNDRINGKDLFLYSKKEYTTPVKPILNDKNARVIFYSLSNLELQSLNEEVEIFFANNKEEIKNFEEILKNDETWEIPDYSLNQIGRLLWYYKQIQENFTSDSDNGLVIHFIRPSFIEFGYNILLSLATNKCLESFQLSFIYLLIYRIVSQTAIEKIKQAEKSVRSNYIFGIGHFLKHRISPVVSNLVSADSNLKNYYGIQDELQISISLARTALFSAKVLDLYGKALAKRLVEDNYAEFSEKNLKKLELIRGEEDESFSKELENHYLSDKELDIKELINEIVELIKTESNIEIKPQFDTAVIWDNLGINPFLKYEINKDENIFLRPAKEVYHQFLHELFKNISKSKSQRGRIAKIQYFREENSLIICRQIDESDVRNLEVAGINYDKFSFIEGEEISGLSLMQHYLDVLGLGEISHKLIEGTWSKLATKIFLFGLGEKNNEQN